MFDFSKIANFITEGDFSMKPFIVAIIGILLLFAFFKVLMGGNNWMKVFGKNFVLSKNKGFLILFVLNFFLFIADIFTTLLNKNILHLVELNPVYRVTQSFLPIILLNLVVFLVVWVAYFKYGAVYRFFWIGLLIMLIFLRVTAVSNALSWNGVEFTEEKLVEMEKTFTPEYKQEALVYYGKVYYSPFFFCLLVFFFWCLDNKGFRKDQILLSKNFEVKKWELENIEIILVFFVFLEYYY